MKTKIIGAVFLLALFSLKTSAQYLPISPELQQKLDGRTKFFDIMQIVDQYYVSKNYHDDPKLYSEYKKWNRWAWYAARHLNSKGEYEYDGLSYFAEAEKMNELQQSRSFSNSGVWNFVGPNTTVWSNNVGSKGIGRVDRIAFHPSYSNIIIAATPAGGLWRTIDGGLNWYSISSNIPNCGISGIFFSEDDPTGNKIYILTGDGDSSPAGFVGSYGFLKNTIGVLVTVDGGVTWRKAGNSETVLNGRRVYKMLQLRTIPWRILVATDNGIYSTNDYGNTWSFTDLWGLNIYDLEQHPVDPNILYAASNATVRKSVNYGGNFDIIPTFTPAQSSATRSALAVTPAQPDEVYFLQCGSTNQIYKSTNSGDTYTSVNSTDLITGQYSYNCSFAVSPSTNQNMVAGGINISSSTNNGTTFGNTTVGIVQNVPVPSNYVHSDIHDLAYHPNGALLYAATDGGVFVSSDNGINWIDRSDGLRCTQYYHMTAFDGTLNLLAGGAQDNGTTFTTNGPTMNYCGTGDGFSVSFVSGDNNIFYMVENTNVMRFTRSTNARVNISPGTNANQTFYPSVIAHPTDNNIVYVGYANSMWRSSTQGSSWTQLPGTFGPSNGGAGHTGGFAVTAASPNRIYAANATTVMRSDDQGNNWTTISGNPGWPATFGVITDLACRPNNATELWITMTGNNGMNRVFYTPDAGDNWINFTGTLPNIPVYCIAYDESGDAYVGTELGVFVMDVSMSDWVPFYNGLPLVPVTDLFVNETFGRVQASTFGRGIWEGDLYSECGPFLLLSGITEGQNFYQSNGFIETNQILPGSHGNVLRLRSPQKITFENGFRAFKGSYVRALIGNCGQGVFNANGEDDLKIEYLNLPEPKTKLD